MVGAFLARTTNQEDFQIAYTDEALEHAEQGLELATRVGHTRAQMIANGAYAFVRTERGEPELGRQAAH